MTTNPVSIEITRIDHKLSSVKVIMPTWTKEGEDGYFYANIPLLGLETYGVSQDDLQVAIEEALTCFCIAAEKNGLGLESELEYLGWTAVEEEQSDNSIMEFISTSRTIDRVLTTGQSRAIKVDERLLETA